MCRLTRKRAVFSDADLVARRVCISTRGEDIATCLAPLPQPASAFLPGQLIRPKFGLQVGEIEREIKQTRRGRALARAHKHQIGEGGDQARRLFVRG